MDGKGILELLGFDQAIWAYNWLCSHRMYVAAAKVARDCGLAERLMQVAAYKAYCQFSSMNAEEFAEQTAVEFGLTIVPIELNSLQGNNSCGANGQRPVAALRLADE